MSKGLRKNAVASEEGEGEVRSSGLTSESGSEMMAMLRVLMEEQRRSELAREEARRQEEERREEVKRQEEERKEVARIERETEATRVRLEQQTAFETQQYEQQVALMRIQAEIGEKASRAHRESQAADRKRDRALYSISVWKGGEDLEEFLLAAEGRLRAADIKKEEWVAIMDSKFSGKLARAWQDICVTVVDYQEAKDRLLKMCGYTPRLAADVFFGFKAENSSGMSADQLYHRGQQLLGRMVAPNRVSEEVEFSILRGWVGTVISKKARAAVDARVVVNASELINALQDYLGLEGERVEGRAAIFGKIGGVGGKEKGAVLTCFRCGKPGHKAADCWGGEGSFSSPSVVSDSTPSKVICYTCREEGHKSNQCPKIKVEKLGPKEADNVKPLRRIWKNKNNDTVLKMKVNSQDASVLLDSGSSVTVVPENMVALAQRTGDTVAVRAFGATKHLVLPMAEVPFEVGDLSWVEPVALAPANESFEEGVVYGLDLLSKRGMELVVIANQGNPANR